MKTPYGFWMAQGRRFDAAVDYGSPISSWSIAMLKNKPIHGTPKPVNVPDDMVPDAPDGCGLMVGDRVTYTNEYGCTFDRVVRGFTSTTHGGGRCVYIDSDAWWFPVTPASLTKE